MESFDWKWFIGQVLVPIATFVGGLFVGKQAEKHKTIKKSKAKVSGRGNIVVQNSTIEKGE